MFVLSWSAPLCIVGLRSAHPQLPFSVNADISTSQTASWQTSAGPAPATRTDDGENDTDVTAVGNEGRGGREELLFDDELKIVLVLCRMTFVVCSRRFLFCLHSFHCVMHSLTVCRMCGHFSLTMMMISIMTVGTTSSVITT